MPEAVELRLARPAGFESMPHEEFAGMIKKRVLAFEQSTAAERRERGIRVLGRERILNQDWNANPNTHAPHFKLDPRVAAKNKWARIEALARNKAFLEAYMEARSRLKSGAKDVVFPAGTWWLHRHASVPCEDEPPCPAPV
jgi:hypothetical protein